MNWLRFLSALLLTGLVAAQPPLQLKGLRGGRPTGSELRHHVIVQFKEQPAPETLRLLQERGASILEYVPQFCYVLAIPGTIFLADLDLEWSGSLTAHEKISPAFKEKPGSRQSFDVIEFYSDVSMAVARAIVAQDHLQIHENPDLLPNDLLVSGTSQALLAVAGRDEVEYIFPASNDLIDGRFVTGCPGALTDQGQVGQSVPKVGSWGPIGGSPNLQYAFVNVSQKLPAAAAEPEIVRALNTWSKYVQVNWTETSNTTADQTVAIMFATGAHGDGYPFNGPGGVVAHTFYPYPVSSEPIAGNMHFNDDENWQIGENLDLYSVALHETGHALGLGHSDEPGAVMYPYYHQVTDLSAEDIGAIQSLYATQGSSTATATAALSLSVSDPGATTNSLTLNLSGSTAGGAAPVVVKWVTDAQISGTAAGGQSWTATGIALHTGTNTITITATDAQNNSVTKTVSIAYVATAASTAPAEPTLQITSPIPTGTYSTNSSSIYLSGTANYIYGVSSVNWATSTDAIGTASGTTSWTSGPIQLTAPTTQISVTALTTDGKTATGSIEVNYSPPPQPTTGSAGAPPTLTIVNPTEVTLAVTTSALAVSGTASSASGIASIIWSTSNGASGTATGTTSWTVDAIPLLAGTNTITIRAYDSTGASSWRSLIASYYPSN
jgi:hypothetical protein